MANELRADGRTGYTHYAQVFNETGQVWNGTTFTALSGATWTDTDIAMSESRSGSGMYLGSFPTGITTAGGYTWRVCEQQGGSPADTDPPVWEGSLVWTGSAIQDLTDLPTYLLDLANGVETGVTLRNALRYIASVLVGTASGAGTTAIAFKSVGGSTTRVSATVDGDGNRTAIVLS